MEWNYVLLWIVGPSTIAIFVQAAKATPRMVGWMGVSAGVAAIGVCLWFAQPQIAGLVVGALWGLFILVPGLLNRAGLRFASRQQFAAASRMARIAGWLHPLDGVWQQGQLLSALALAEGGQAEAAVDRLEKLKNAHRRIARVSQLHIFRIRNQWGQLVQWVQTNFDARTVGREITLLSMYLRGLGEIGQVDQMLLVLDGNRALLDAGQHGQVRNMCRLIAFAFAGQPVEATAAMRKQLSFMPQKLQQFWLATAELATDQPQAGRERLAGIAPSGSAGLASAIAYRLQSPPSAPVLSSQAGEILRRLDQERDQEDRFAQRWGVGRRPWATYAMILANCIMFAMEAMLGGTTDPDAQFRLGAFDLEAVRGGQYWRLLAANFLHDGSAHIVMNMLALLILGPFVERAIGLGWFLLLYLLSGVGAIATVGFLQAHQIVPEGTLVGASGAIMGLIGATAAILLRGWMRERARFAGRRLRLIVSIVLIQIIFDQMTPQVSGSAHLAGIVWGFVLASLIPHRTSRANQVPRVLP